jgi:hypothetical protein
MQLLHMRQQPDENVTFIPVSMGQDTRLTLTALGVMMYIASFPDGHHLNAASIAAASASSLDEVKAALTLLIECGYLRMQPRQTDDGWVTDLIVDVLGAAS